MIPLPTYEPHIVQLERLLGAPDPLVFVPEADDGWIAELLDAWILRGDRRGVESWDAAKRRESRRSDGVKRFDDPSELAMFLERWRDAVKPTENSGVREGALWLREPGECTLNGSSPGGASLRDIATLIRRCGSCWRVLVTGANAAPTPSLAPFSQLQALDRPKLGGIEAFASACLDSAEWMTERHLKKVAERVKGLDASAIRRVLLAAVHNAKENEADDLVAEVRRERKRLVQDAAIEVRDLPPNHVDGMAGVRLGFRGLCRDEIREKPEESSAPGRADRAVPLVRRPTRGGRKPIPREFSRISTDRDPETRVRALQSYLEDVATLFRLAREDEKSPAASLLPRGVFLIGPPGCGKSLAAEVAAARMDTAATG